MRRSSVDVSTPPTSAPITTRRALTLGAGAFSAIGITAGIAASVPQPHPDAELLAMRPRLMAAARALEASDASPSDDDDALAQICDELEEASWAIVDAEPARTDEGLALKASAVMYHLRIAYSHGCWPGDGEEMAWNLLSELAGDAYTPCGEYEPGRA